MHKILTLDNLYQFFVEQNKSVSFSAKENGKPIVVSAPANFEVSDDDIEVLDEIQNYILNYILFLFTFLVPFYLFLNQKFSFEIQCSHY